ncbi:MAG: hypothetical protein ABUT20_48015 [Bacteroidota bacterium]
MNRSLLIIIWTITMQHNVSAQSKMVFENYNYWGQHSSAVFVPMIHIETKNNWYAEIRYNYEADQTLSVFAGKSFYGGNKITYSITPLVGISAGLFSGASFATNADVEWDNFYFSSQSQFSRSFKKEIPDFFFTWSEAGYNISPNIFAGLALQYTRQLASNEAEPGIMAGINFKNFSIPFYVFKPFHSGGYFVLGLNYEYNLRKRK